MRSPGTFTARLLATATVAAGLAIGGPAPAVVPLQPAEPTLHVRLFNAQTGDPVANVAVTMTSDNGIAALACVRAGCDTGATSWQGTSDWLGYVLIPAGIAQRFVHFAAGPLSGDLVETRAFAGAMEGVAELFPGDQMANGRPIKLVDAASGAPLARAAVVLDYRTRDGMQHMLACTTNAIGYVFVPFEVATVAADDTWVSTRGYRRARLDFAWARHRTALQRQ